MTGSIYVPEDFDPMPSAARASATTIAARDEVPDEAAALGVPVGVGGDVPAELGVDREALKAIGFEGKVGQAVALASVGPVLVAVGVGEPAELDGGKVRDVGAAFALAAAPHASLASHLADLPNVSVSEAAQALVEGILLARYSYTPLLADPGVPPVTSLTLVVPTANIDQAQAGATRGATFATVHRVSRDLATTPPAHLTATRMADLAVAMGARRGLDVTVFDRDQLIEMGCGGLLGVNAGSIEEPRMIKLVYRPAGSPEPGSTPHLTLVGKGIMYDSGGISLKPSDGVHATMKNDMSGAGAVFAVMSALAALDCRTAVTAYLMCTDNMPSGSALKLGDVITMRGGTTVEIMNTDAEGRLVMADALVLATEEPTDAIVDIATLTGACLRALGTQVAGILGNDQQLVDQLIASGAATDEPLWQLPLERRYRPEIDSEIADLRNLGGANAGSITAALFLEEFVDGIPWAHIDIAGTSQNDVADGWRIKGTTGFGARLLLEFVLQFTRPAT
jgi:leucyl aminopeptidase